MDNLFKNKKFVIYGTGRTGIEFYSFIKKFIKIDFFIDSNSNKKGSFIDDIIVNDLEILNYKEKTKDIIFIVASNIYQKEINDILRLHKYIENENYFSFQNFITLFMWEKYKKIYINEVNIFITSRCTLKCKHCSMLIPYYKEYKDRNIDSIKIDVDMFFANVDFVRSFTIFGGEPFLHKKLDEILIYIGEKYINRIENVRILTNNSVKFCDKILNVVYKYNMEISISDYRETNPNYSRVYEANIASLKNNNVRFIIPDMDKWVDFGDPFLNKNQNESILKEKFYKCAMLCRFFHEGKYYYCSRHFAANNSKVYDKIDGTINLKDKISKPNFILFETGKLSNGFISYCQYCDGSQNVNNNRVDSATQ